MRPSSIVAWPATVWAVTLFDVHAPTPDRGVDSAPWIVVGSPDNVRLPLVPTFPPSEASTGTPPTTATSFTQNGGCPADVTNCVVSPNGATITPGGGTVSMGNVSLTGQAELHLGAGTYIVNSLSIIGSSQIIIDSGPVIFQIAGQGIAGDVLTIEGDGISNTSYNPQNLQFVYAGTENVSVAGGTETSALLYAPNATGGFAGGSDFYGAVILKQITATGGSSIHYDRRLQYSAFVPGKHMMSSFTWRTF